MPLFSLGVLAVYMNKSQGLEEHSFFKQMIIAGKSLDVDVYIFTPNNVDERNKKIYAYSIEPSRNQWVRKWISYPDLFFDRTRYQSIERYRQVSQFKKRNPTLTFISAPLSNKWNLHQVLVRKPSIKPFLPTTLLYSRFNDLRQEVLKRGLVFLKPINGTGGRGILRIQRLQSGTYSIRGRTQSRRIIPEQRVTMPKLRSMIMQMQPSKRFIVQQGIDLRLHTGSVHDYRLLIQKNGSGKWEVTGCVGRIGASGSVTSNLHGGGRAIPMLKLLKIWFKNEKKATHVAEDIHSFSHQLVEVLEDAYGRLCELALDIAVDHSGRVWLLEVNTKPAREVFARIGDQSTYRKAIRRPIEFAKWIYQSKAGAS
ncbi:MAG: YheC/YheD family protein [Paenibacillaceae bacterium]